MIADYETNVVYVADTLEPRFPEIFRGLREILADHGRLLSFEIVEVNPVIDEHNRTAELAVELICSAFGKKIL